MRTPSTIVLTFHRSTPLTRHIAPRRHLARSKQKKVFLASLRIVTTYRQRDQRSNMQQAQIPTLRQLESECAATNIMDIPTLETLQKLHPECSLQHLQTMLKELIKMGTIHTYTTNTGQTAFLRTIKTPAKRYWIITKSQDGTLAVDSRRTLQESTRYTSYLVSQPQNSLVLLWDNSSKEPRITYIRYGNTIALIS